MDNLYVENHLENITGIKVEHCEYMYHCVYNNLIVATLEVSLIHNTLELTSGQGFTWNVQECTPNISECSADLSNPTELALLITKDIVKTM